jgi:cysteinyl-tRNA synthetase
MFGFLQKIVGAKKASTLPPLYFANTLSGEKERFTPLGLNVRMYNCGPTVYDRQHIGNLRPYVFADTLRRTLEVWGYPTHQVINITDVGHLVSDADEGEDKMEASAKKLKRTAQEIAHEVTEWWFDDLDALGIERRKIEFPRATAYIDEIIALVKSLEQKGYAYKITDGMYFDTARFPGYGKLGQIDLAHQQAGARVEENIEKKNPHDFALWKFSPKRKKRQQEWASPWGKGFPGWHIECTAMIFKLLGRQIDIHTGGIDHIPVHHNNEIAQAEAITGKQYVRYWMHNEFITIDGKKISKSLGNTVYLSQLVDRGLSARALRYLYLTAHYRSPINFTWGSIEGADAALGRLKRLYMELPPSHLPPDPAFENDFYTAIAHDLDTPRALARVWELVKDEKLPPAVKKVSLALADRVLGLGLTDHGPTAKMVVAPPEVKKLVDEREAARAAKDFKKSDELRAKIESLGFDIKDTPQGPKLTEK